MGVGVSAHPDPVAAGVAAATQAITGADPKLVVLMCNQSYDAAAVLAAVRSVTGDLPLIGCASTAEIAAGEAARGSVVVTVIGGAGFTASTAAASLKMDGPRAAGTAVAEAVPLTTGRQHRVLIMLVDGSVPDHADIVRGAYAVVGASIPLVGGASVGDDVPDSGGIMLHDGQVISGAVVAALLESDAPMGVGFAHGWRSAGDPLLVTRSGDGRVYELDGKPALDAYLDAMTAPAAAYTDPEAFDLVASVHPLSLRRLVTDQVRGISSTPNFTDRSLGSGAHIPEGTLTWIMEATVESTLDAVAAACGTATAALDGAPPIGYLAFDCVARHAILGDDGVLEELVQLRTGCGDAPVAGFYTWGEIARLSGIDGYHHQTLAMLAMA